MKVLLAALGSAGDVHPAIAIGAELGRRGHGVTLVANAWFEPTIRREGLGFVAAGTVDDYRRAVANGARLTPPVRNVDTARTPGGAGQSGTRNSIMRGSGRRAHPRATL